MSRKRERGQALVLFAGGLLGLCALVALALDLSSVYSTQQTERAAADAAALAGGQDLQQVGTRRVGAAEQQTARKHALEDLAGRFGVSVPTGPGCSPSARIVGCQLTPLTPSLVVSISSPSKTTLDPRSIQVTVGNPNFQLSFARLFGQNDWNVSQTSVAVIDYGGKYAIMTLQPPRPKPNGTDANLCKNLVVNGNGTVLNVVRGDIGTNTSATTTLKGVITLADGYRLDHLDDLPSGGCSYSTPGASWARDASGNPTGHHIGPSPFIQDPAYPIANDFEGTYATSSAGVVPCMGSSFPSDAATVALLTPPSGGTLTCYGPGIYQSKFILTSNKDVAYLMPGAYRFDDGMKLGGRLAGGMIDSKPGVVLVFALGTTLDPNNTVSFTMNTGSATCDPDSCRAQPARDAKDVEVKTPEGLTITIEVPRDDSCFSGTDPVNTNACDGYKTVTLGGSGSLNVAGVIYAPSDNVAVAGNSATAGFVGQIIAWTVTYSGQGKLNQDYPGGAGNGVLRLDMACSGGNTPCVP